MTLLVAKKASPPEAVVNTSGPVIGGMCRDDHTGQLKVAVCHTDRWRIGKFTRTGHTVIKNKY